MMFPSEPQILLYNNGVLKLQENFHSWKIPQYLQTRYLYKTDSLHGVSDQTQTKYGYPHIYYTKYGSLCNSSVTCLYGFDG